MTETYLAIEAGNLPPEAEALRGEVREFLREHMAGRDYREAAKSWQASDPEFSRALGARGWIGMTWSKEYGGQGRSTLERYVLNEELIAASAPVAAHWVGDRQTGPLILRFGSETMKRSLLPRVARGEVFFCVGMSEPDSGSDLASLRTRGVKTSGGWVINGTKVWTSLAHSSHFMVTAVRTGEPGESRQGGLSQFLIDLRTPGISMRPIRSMAGEHDFNEVSLVDVEVPDDALIGEPGDGWKQVTAELGYERSGPERYLSATRLFLQMVEQAPRGSARHAVAIGRIVAAYATLRQMSLGIANMLSRGENPALAAALVKDIGTAIEQDMTEVAHELFDLQDTPQGGILEGLAGYATMLAPGYTIKGGAREILRGIIARGLGLR